MSGDMREFDRAYITDIRSNCFAGRSGREPEANNWGRHTTFRGMLFLRDEKLAYLEIAKHMLTGQSVEATAKADNE